MIQILKMSASNQSSEKQMTANKKKKEGGEGVVCLCARQWQHAFAWDTPKAIAVVRTP